MILPRRQQGVAMAMVLWFVAAMTILVAGIVYQARVDTQFAQVHLARAKAIAAADGAILLAVAQLHGEGIAAAPGVGVLQSLYTVGDLPVQVTLTPASGLVDLNTVSLEFLRDMFIVLAAMEPDAAQQLADNVVKWRTSSAYRGRSNQFETPEDLLKVPGMTRGVFDQLRDSVGFAEVGSGKLSWAGVPDALLAVLALRNADQARGHVERRAQSPGDGAARTSANTGGYRVDAVVEYGGQFWMRRRWVKMGAVGARSSAPWRYLRTEAGRVVN